MRISYLVVVTVLLSGCAAPTASPVSTATPTSTAAPTVQPTSTPTASQSASTAPTPQLGEVVKVPLPSAYQGPLLPGAEAQLGYGTVWTISVSPGGDLLAIGTSSGVAIYNLPDQTMHSFTPTDFQASRIAWSPSGDRLIALDGYWETPRSLGAMIDARSGALRYRIAEHSMRITDVDWSPDGRSFLTAAIDGLLLVWDAASGQVRHRIVTTWTYTWDGKDYPFSSDKQGLYLEQYASFNADGSMIVNNFWEGADAPSPETVFTVWDAHSGAQIVQVHKDKGVNSVTWHPKDPALLLVAGDQESSTLQASTYDVSQHKESAPVTIEHLGGFPGMSWTPDGTMAYTLSQEYEDSDLTTFLDAKTLKVRFTIPRVSYGGVQFRNHAIVISPSRYRENEHSPTVWDARTGRQIDSVDGLTPDSMNGRLIVGKDSDGIEAAIDASSGVCIEHYDDRLIHAESSAYSLAWSPDGSQLLTTGDAATLWDVQARMPIEAFHAHILNGQDSDHTSASWAGQALAIGEDWGILTVWRPDGPRAYPLEPGSKDHNGPLEDTAISPDGALIAVGEGGIGGALSVTRLFDMTTRQWQPALPFGGNNLAWSPDGHFLAARDPSNSLVVWDIQAKREAARVAAEGTEPKNYRASRGLAWSPDGKRVAEPARDQTIIFLSVDGTNKFSRMNVPLPGSDTSTVTINALAWTGNLLAAAYNVEPDWGSGSPVTKQPRNTIILWNVETGQAVRTLTGHNADIVDLAFSPDGSLLASADASGVTLLWPAR